MKLITKHDSVSILLIVDSIKNKMFIVELDTANNSIKLKNLNEKTFLVDSLHISDFDFFTKDNDLYLFVFDEF